jgi:hypothetical protein
VIDRSEWPGFVAVELVDGWYVRLRWVNNPQIDADVAAAAATLIEEANGGVDRPLLVEMAAQNGLTREARMIFLEARTMLRIALLGTSAVDRVVANFSLGVGVSRPVAFFTDREDAMVWLRTGELPPDSTAPVAHPAENAPGRRPDDRAPR